MASSAAAASAAGSTPLAAPVVAFIEFAAAQLETPSAEDTELTDALQAHATAVQDALSSMSIVQSRETRQALHDTVRALRKSSMGRFFSGPAWDTAASDKSVAERLRAIRDSSEYSKYTAVSAAIARTLSDMVGALGEGRSNRSRRAAKASDILSRHAGLNTIPGAEVDAHGNALTSAGDLCADGAFGGQTKIVIVDLVGVDVSRPVEALERKGLVVEVRKGMTSVAELERCVADASQLWIISAGVAVLSSDVVDAIAAQWRGGLALYVFGDNLPLYVDANRILTACGLPTMQGNEMADTVVGPAGSDPSIAGGFMAGELATTGIMRLYEGVTVALFEENAIVTAGFVPVLREHRTGKVIVARRAAMDDCGPVVVDGAFTKLYYKWDGAGSARFVTNLATILAVDLPTEAAVCAAAPADVEELDLEGAMRAECAVTMEEDVACIALKPAADPTMLTADVHLDNALGCGRAARTLVLPHVYGLAAGKMFATAGSNPFTREALELVVPAVSLRSKANRAILGEILCHGLLGGASMPQKALHMFHAACQEVVVSGDDDKGVFGFMCRELEMHTFTKCTFTDEGPRARLQDAMHFFAHSLESMEQRKVFSFCEAVAQALLRIDGARAGDEAAARDCASRAGAATSSASTEPKKEEEAEATPADAEAPAAAASAAREAADAEEADEEDGAAAVVCMVGAVDRAALRTMLRRSLVRTLVSSLVQLGKRQGVPALRAGLDQMLFDVWHGIPRAGSAKLITVPELITAVMPPVGAADTLNRVTRVETALADGEGALLSTADATLLCAWARYRSRTWTVSGDKALLEYLETVPGAAVWAGVQVASDPRDAVSLLFRLMRTEDGTPIPVFATTLGPSVLRWSDGRWLADPTAADAGSEEWVNALREVRRAALRDTFGSTDANGYPHAGLRSKAASERTAPAAASTEAPADASTEAPADASTEAPAAASTEAPTDASAEALESGAGGEGSSAAPALPEDPRECMADLTGDATWLTAALGTAHCNLHRAVQTVLGSEEFAGASKVTEDMEAAVAAYLLADGKGNIYDPLLHEGAAGVMASYMAARAKGMADPVVGAKGKVMIPFEDKVKMELADAAVLWGEAVASGAAPVLYTSK